MGSPTHSHPSLRPLGGTTDRTEAVGSHSLLHATCGEWAWAATTFSGLKPKARGVVVGTLGE